MALPTPTPRQGSSHYTTNTVFSFVYICQKPASVAYPDKKKQLQDKPIIALKKLRQMQAQKAKFISNRKPG